MKKHLHPTTPNPYTTVNQAAAPKTLTQYDALGRVIRTTHPDGTFGTQAYYLAQSVNDGDFRAGRVSSNITDANNHVKRYSYDGRGELRVVTEFVPGSEYRTRYTYDALGNLTRVSDAVGNTTVLTYNALSQKTTMVDPDMGQWTYEYDAAGNLITQTDALNNVLWFKYDPLNRLTEKRQTSSSGPLLAQNGYGSSVPNIGYRLRRDDISGYTTWAYDQRGRVLTETKVISGTSGGTFVTQWDYDALDRPLWMKYPGGNAGQVGEQVNFTYNSAGWLNSVVGANPYVQSTTHDAAGRVEARVLGSNVVQQDYVYYPWTTANGQGRLQQLKAGTLTPNDPTSLQNVQYTYDAVGNVLTILDNKAGPQTQTFHYDSLDRLADATASGGTGGTYPLETYTYNPIGNLTSKAGVAQWYSDTLHPHAVTHLNGVQKFWYDANGNMVTRNDSTGSFTQQWDKENRLITVTGTASGSFVYDGDGNRVKATLNGTTTAYIGNYYEQTGAAIKKYYYAGGTRIAVNDNGTLYWLLGDHLGSTAITANSGGGKYAELRYTPWGEERYTNGVTTPTRRQYTGQINDSEIGLYFYNARSYSSVLGRFISADTIVPDVSDPQSWNRFSYTRNNPINRIDPSGHADALPDDGGVSIKTLIEMVEKAKNGYMASGAPMPSWDSLQRETQKGLSLSSAGWSKTSWNLEFGHCDRSCPDVWAHHDLFGEPINAAIWTLGGMYFFARVAAGAAVLEEGGIGALSGGPSGALSIEGNLSAYSSSEIGAARYLANLGDDVVLRSASNIKRTSDLLVNGVAYDVYTPQTSNVARIVSAIAKKNSQAQGIIVDLSQTALNPGDLGNLLARVRGAGATNITDIIIMPK